MSGARFDAQLQQQPNLFGNVIDTLEIGFASILFCLLFESHYFSPDADQDIANTKECQEH